MLTEISQRNTNSILSYFYVNLKKIKLIEPESRLVVARGKGMGEMGDVVKEYKFPVIRWVRIRDVMYSIVNVVNNTITYLKVANDSKP